MGTNTKIEWCDHTVNLWWGCSKVHTGCDNCYAENTARRWGNDVWGNDKNRKEIKKAFSLLVKLNKEAKEQGVKHTVFMGSMQDIFEKPMPFVDSKGVLNTNANTGNLRFQLFYLIDRGDFDNLIFLFLTKRPSNIKKYIFESWKENPPANVWFGCSISDQETADNLVRLLLTKTPRNANLFLSIEPQVGKIDLTPTFKMQSGVDYKHNYLTNTKEIPISNGRTFTPQANNKISWVIQGGESGQKRRPFKLEWAYLLKRQCKEAGVPYFFKQIDKVKTIPPDMLIREFPRKFEK